MTSIRKNKSDGNPVGMIVHSLLTEAQFQALNGIGWVLADGRSITGSKYAEITGATTIPDMRGQFLRGKNNGRSDGNQDSAGERALGDYKADKMQGHRHNSVQGAQFILDLNAGDASGANGTTRTRGLIGDPSSDGTNGTPRTGSETQPKNIAVNIFIKINQ